MTETLDRDELAALLARLGDDDDAAALRAAREAHARVAAAGLSWAALLAPADDADAEDALEVADVADAADAADADDAADAGEADEADAAGEVGAAGAEGAGTDAESLALIGQLLARRDVSQELRDELDGYKADIAAGEFTEADRRYLRAMHRRLSK